MQPFASSSCTRVACKTEFSRAFFLLIFLFHFFSFLFRYYPFPFFFFPSLRPLLSFIIPSLILNTVITKDLNFNDGHMVLRILSRTINNNILKFVLLGYVQRERYISIYLYLYEYVFKYSVPEEASRLSNRIDFSGGRSKKRVEE